MLAFGVMRWPVAQLSQNALLVPTILLFSLQACKDPGGLKGCGIELESILLAAPSPNVVDQTAHLIAHLRIFNDAPIDTKLHKLIWMVEVDGQALARGKTPKHLLLKHQSSHSDTLKIPLSNAGATWVANAMNKPHRQVRLMGFCQIQAAGAAKEVPFDAKHDVH